MDAVRLVEGEVRELIRTRGLDPARQVGEVQLLVRDALADYEERSMLGALPPLLDDPSIEEIWIRGAATPGGGGDDPLWAWGSTREIGTMPEECLQERQGDLPRPHPVPSF
ncbi:hypothetical protein [Arthrobacter antioxidans]|uniref:hypothetical protein n=1 Tax=Arthrobacter antioxidans TaxID=2895818 RepID=UPI003AF0D451